MLLIPDTLQPLCSTKHYYTSIRIVTKYKKFATTHSEWIALTFPWRESRWWGGERGLPSSRRAPFPRCAASCWHSLREARPLLPLRVPVGVRQDARSSGRGRHGDCGDGGPLPLLPLPWPWPRPRRRQGGNCSRWSRSCGCRRSMTPSCPSFFTSLWPGGMGHERRRLWPFQSLGLGDLLSLDAAAWLLWWILILELHIFFRFSLFLFLLSALTQKRCQNWRNVRFAMSVDIVTFLYVFMAKPNLFFRVQFELFFKSNKWGFLFMYKNQISIFCVKMQIRWKPLYFTETFAGICVCFLCKSKK